MRLQKLQQIVVITFFMLIFASCSSSSDEQVEAQTVQNNSVQGETIPANATYESVENGFRLTENSLKSVIPEMLLGIEKSGEVDYEESRSGSGLYSTVYQMYYDSDNYSANYLDIFDYGDDQEHINDMMEGMRYTNFDFSRTYQNDQGWYITETFDSRGDDITSRTLTVRNPRFMIELRTVPGDATEIPSFDDMMNALDQANLLELMELEIPQGEVESPQVAEDNRNDLVCDDLLPVDRVRSYCGIDGVEVNVTSFEQQKNCNRQYSHPDNFGGLTFIVTQYSDDEMAVQAVQTKLNDDLNSESIADLGEVASMVTVEGDLFLSVAHQNYLIELRSSEGMGPTETASLCLDEGQLGTLANDVIAKLP